MTSHNRCPVNCIVPDHILRRLLDADNPKIKDAAFQTLSITAQLRGQRDIVGGMPSLFTSRGGGLRRTIFNANHKPQLPGTLVRGEQSSPSGEESVDRAYDGLGATYNFYREVLDRNSIDNAGMRLDASVHYSQNYNNAFWDGRQMVFGDGDGLIFVDFTKSLDVIGHELTHGVTQYESGLEYFAQSGALNESMSDVFGIMVKQYAARLEVGASDWLIGKEILVPATTRTALRSMKAPGTAYRNDPILGDDPQPSHMDNYDETPFDNQGVHINSGIPNRAFYVCAEQLGGYAWERAGRIWYSALTAGLQPQSQFTDAALATVTAARNIYGVGSREHAAVLDAWEEVGLGVAPSTRGPGPVSWTSTEVDGAAENWDGLIDSLADRVLERVLGKLERKVKAQVKPPRPRAKR
jgi:Zn-dependent metalloprotease